VTPVKSGIRGADTGPVPFLDSVRGRSSRRTTRRPLVVAGLLAAVLLPAAAALPAWASVDNPDHGPTSDGALAGPDGRCAPATDRVFAGSLRGADGLGVNATIGFDMQDAAGHTVDLATGCAAHGYSTILQINHDVSSRGQAVGTATQPSNSAPTSVVTDRYAIRGIPANIVSTFIEVYPRDYTGSPCGWGCGGNVDVSKYGGVNRRSVPMDTGGVDIRLPLTTAFGGSTGTIAITATDHAGNAVAVRDVHSWSMLTPDGSRPDQGWGFGVVDGPGKVHVPALAGGQDYVTDLVTDKGTFRVKHLGVRAGQITGYHLDTDGPLVVDLVALPARSVAVRQPARRAFPCGVAARGLGMTFRCTSVRAPNFSIATLSYFGYGTWIAANRTRVAPNHSFVLSGHTKYAGVTQWRVDVSGRRDTFTVTSR